MWLVDHTRIRISDSLLTDSVFVIWPKQAVDNFVVGVVDDVAVKTKFKEFVHGLLWPYRFAAELACVAEIVGLGVAVPR